MKDALDVTIDQLYARHNAAPSKDFLIAQLKLLSAMESWAYSVGKPLPEYIQAQLGTMMLLIEKELRK